MASTSLRARASASRCARRQSASADDGNDFRARGAIKELAIAKGVGEDKISSDIDAIFAPSHGRLVQLSPYAVPPELVGAPRYQILAASSDGVNLVIRASRRCST